MAIRARPSAALAPEVLQWREAREYSGYSIKFGFTVDSLITHTPPWMAKDMGYEGLWGEGAILVWN